MSKPKIKTLHINDLKKLEEEFYERYNPDYWLYKINFLKNAHDNYDNIQESLINGLEGVIGGIDEDDYKRMMRTELHFLYFQMIETLFELIFAVSKFDRSLLWLALSFSDKRYTIFHSDCYNKIKSFSNSTLIEPDLDSFKEYEINGKTIKIPLLKWIFYGTYSLEMSDDEWKINLDNIHYLLKKFARDFTDREQYNAYKHSLRFHNTPFFFGIAPQGSSNFRGQKTDDSVIYLKTKQIKDDSNSLTVRKCVKPFEFEKDYNLCMFIWRMISNIIKTRMPPIPKTTSIPLLSGFLDFKFEDIEYNSFIEYSDRV